MTVSVEAKAEFLYHIYQEWSDGLAYRDEPINTIIATQDITRAICDLFVVDLLDVNEPDYSFFVNQSYDIISQELQEEEGS